MRTLGDRLDTYRRSVMLARQTGLTKTYNLVFDPTIHDEDIAELRRIHEAIDRATVTAYGWTDLLDRLDHGFHPAGRDLRYTIGPWAAARDPRPPPRAQPRALRRGGGQGPARQEEGAHRPGAEEVRRRGPVLMPPSPRRCEIRSGKMRRRSSPWALLRVYPGRGDELGVSVSDSAQPSRGGG